ncbi:MAG: CehA/McbA family metallohydrolase [Myxococcota bacterium]|nr:CehA/McbA family metallohydrolase [Myxococcota bacterium]
MKESGYGRSPVVCQDRIGNLWTSWISFGPTGESIAFSRRSPRGEWSTPQRWEPSRPHVTGLAIAPWGDGIIAAWVDGEEDEIDGLKVAVVTPSSISAPILITPHRRGPAHPALSTSATHFVLAWTIRQMGGRQVVAHMGEDPFSIEEIVRIDDGGGYNISPTVACLENSGVVVWQNHRRSLSQILARRLDKGSAHRDIIPLCSDAQGICALPAVHPSAQGNVWVAWQTDNSPKTGPGLARQIHVVEMGRDDVVRRPVAPLPDVEDPPRGEDQGFEAPAITVADDGHLVVIGRGSQSIRRQDLGTQGWSDRIQIDDPGWQCRGRRFAVASAGEHILIVGRERDGIAVRTLPAVIASVRGHPELSPVEAKIRCDDGASAYRPEHRHIVAGQRVLFGDLHQHTAHSDGTGTIEETYARARFRYEDDIVAVADHESFLGKQTPPGEWAEMRRIADEFYRPGRFVTLTAFEWTGRAHPGPGHKVVYLPADGGPVLSRESNATKTGEGLISAAHRLGALVVPHHVGWTGANMSAHDPTVQTCFEIVSCHGAYERIGAGPIGTRGDDKPGEFIADALDKGLRFGFTGGSDGHGLNWHHGVCRKQDSHRSGLTGVFSSEVSREGVLNALRRRRCYATSGEKIGLWFEIDSRPMGEELVVGWPVPFRVVVSATAPIRSISLVSNEGQEIQLNATGKEADIRGTLEPPTPSGWCYYFVRVIQEDDAVAWSSPIWLDAPSTA